MRFQESKLLGAWVIEPERHADERGYFARTFCRREFAEHGLETEFVQASVSFNQRRGTLRGMHFQVAPSAEAKLVSCARGAILDVIIDLRKQSPTFLEHVAVSLNPESKRTLYVPKEFAHGFLTLEDNTEVCYQMSTFHAPDDARGIRWNDPLFAIEWPGEPAVISGRDAGYGDFDETRLKG